MTHLGTQLSALADGQLPPALAERAMAHVAGCTECADGLRAARAARRTLAEAFEVRPAPDLTARLMALGAAMPPASPAPRPGRTAPRSADLAAPRTSAHQPDVVRAHAVASVPLPGTTTRLPAGCLHGELGRRAASPRSVALAGASLAAVCLVLLTLGGQVLVAPQRHPAHALTVLARAGGSLAGETQVRTVASTGASTAAASVPSESSARAVALVRRWTAARPWSVPVVVPAGHTVVDARVDPDGVEALEVDLLGPHGLVVVTQTHGVLDPAAVATADSDGDGVHVLSTAPWHGVWQSGEVVVSVVAEVVPAVDGLVAAYPAQASDAGVPARLARGWQVLAGAWSGP